jgi:hypothetical protein
MMTTKICGKRTRRFLCTLPANHNGQHGRQYRRDSKAEKERKATTAPAGCACHQGGIHTQDLD